MGKVRTAASVLLGGIAGLVISSPAIAASLKLDMPPPVSAPPLASDVKIQPISLTRIAANIAPGTAWFQEASFPLCVGGRTAYWNESSNTVELPTFERIFRDQMQESGLSRRESNSLFEEKAAPNLQVGALITELLVKACSRPSIGGGALQESATMNVEWQIYSTIEGKVLARITTHAGATFGSGDPRNITSVISGVFADSVHRLAADRQFRALVTAPTTQAAPTPPRLVFTPPEQRVTVEAAVKGVVVIFAGDAMGSGILISPDGYILTNRHVTGDSDRVRIRWADGAEDVGQVVRSDIRRDVALIRAPGRPEALPIRAGSAKIGETVFAIGTPLQKDFQNTLTKGVVSANRSYDGLPFIQSDVAVDHGNSGGPLLDEQGRVLGITQWVYAPDGVSHNLNFFIPIEDALRALSLTAAPAAAPLHAAAAPPARPAKKR